MSQTEQAPPFGQHDYEILYGSLEDSRDVDISAVLARPLMVGELFTFGRGGRLYDVIVGQITALADGGWRARCSVVDLQWM